MPQQITLELVKKYIRRFDEEGKSIERTIAHLVKATPKNSRFEDVLVKVCVINVLYSAGIRGPRNIEKMARRIHSLSVDRHLASGDVGIVDKIARELGGRSYCSLTTKYCSWHNPACYPIYDSNMMKALRLFGYEVGAACSDYRRFVNVIESFRNRYGLTDFDFKAIDKFLYLYGREQR